MLGIGLMVIQKPGLSNGVQSIFNISKPFLMILDTQKSAVFNCFVRDKNGKY
jgi:hypothetical protein